MTGPALITTVPYGRCVSCGTYGYLDENDSTCLTACDALRPGYATPRPTPASCDCGAAAADPVSTRRDGGGGHSEWCAVGGRP